MDQSVQYAFRDVWAMDDVETESWSERVEDVAFRCDRNSIAPSELICEMHGLLASGPSHICADIRPELPRSSLDRLLEAGAFDGAALRLVKRCGYFLSGNGEGLFIGTVAVPAAGRELSYSASSEAVALCGALALALIESLSAARP
jgi:hypothetical protein